MNHTNATDVTLNLRAPNGTNINLISASGGTNNDIMTVFDDFADSLLNSSLVPFSMRIKPVIPLSTLPQTNQNGYWRLSVTDAAGVVDSGRVHMWGIKFIPTVGISSNNNIPQEYALYQNYPNPFNPVTKIKFDIPLLKGSGSEVGHGALTKLIIYDILGRETANLVNNELTAGTYEINWDASAYSSGIYFYKLIVSNNGQIIFENSKKMLIIK
jgi:hypothetical protein